MRLWRDGGDGQFDAGGADDRNLGVFAPWGGRWSISGLSESLGQGGARLFVAVTTASTVVDSATVQLELPVGGLEVESGNDGPIDVPVVNPEFLTLTDRVLAATLSAVPDAVVVGQLVNVQMAVVNRSSGGRERGHAVDADDRGTAGLAYQSGPVHPRCRSPRRIAVVHVDLPSDDTGNARFTGTASGVGAGAGRRTRRCP